MLLESDKYVFCRYNFITRGDEILNNYINSVVKMKITFYILKINTLLKYL